MMSRELQNRLEKMNAKELGEVLVVANGLVQAKTLAEREAQKSRLNKLIEAEGIDLADLGLSIVPVAQKAAAVRAKYRNTETNETWSGRGRKPRWIEAAIKGGRKLEDFQIEEASAQSAAPPAVVGAKPTNKQAPATT